MRAISKLENQRALIAMTAGEAEYGSIGRRVAEFEEDVFRVATRSCSRSALVLSLGSGDNDV